MPEPPRHRAAPDVALRTPREDELPAAVETLRLGYEEIAVYMGKTL